MVRLGEPSTSTGPTWKTLSENLEDDEETNLIRGALVASLFHNNRIELGLALIRRASARTRAKVLGSLIHDAEYASRDVRLRWMCHRELHRETGTEETLEKELREVVQNGGIGPLNEDDLLSALARTSDGKDRRIAMSEVLAAGEASVLRRMEAEEDRRYLEDNPDGLLARLQRDLPESPADDPSILQLTRLHNELLHGCLIQASLHNTAIAKRALSAELRPVFLAMLWDEAEGLEEVEALFEEFGEPPDGGNTVTKLWGLLRHRLLLSLRLGRKVLPQDTRVQLLSENTLDLVEGSPAYTPRQRASLAHDLSVYHVRGFTQSFFRAFALTNASFGEGREQDQIGELESLLQVMRGHLRKAGCSFRLTWMGWFCYVFLNCRYLENMSSWRSYAAAIYPEAVQAGQGGRNQGGHQTPLALEFFDSVIGLVEGVVGSSEELGVDGDYVRFALADARGVAVEDEGESEMVEALDRIVQERRQALEHFVDQARWRSDIVRRMIGERASWAEIFRILHATPVSLLQICKSYNEYGLCDETVKKYEIPEAEASSVQLAEFIDHLATKASVDGMITGMISDEDTAAEFESYVEGSKMDHLERLLLYLDVGASVAANAEVSSRMLRNARGALSEAKAQAGAPSEEILGHCSKALAALEGLVAGGDASSVSKSISSADVARCGERIGDHVKAVQMLAEAAQLAEDGKRQFLSGVLHNICRALSADSSIERETFQERLRSAGLLVPVLGEEAAEGGEKREREEGVPQRSSYLSSFISYLAHIGDAIASIDNQDTYNHFGLLHRDPRDILMYILFERKDPEIAARIAKLLHTNLIDEVLKACVPRVFPPLSGLHSEDDEEGERDAISKHDWDKNILVLKSLVEKSPLRVALACLFISYRESGQESDILSFALEQLSAYPTLHRWIKIQFFIQQMKARITNDACAAKSTVLESNFEMEQGGGALRGCLWEDLEVYREAIGRITSNGKLNEALMLSDRCFQEGSPDSLLLEMIEAEEGGEGGSFELALRIQDEDELWSVLQRFKELWSLQELILLTCKCKSIASDGGPVLDQASALHRRLRIYERVLEADGPRQGSWRGVEDQCVGDPERLLKRLSGLGAHKLVLDVAEEFCVSGPILQELEGAALFACLSERPVDGGGVPGVTRRLSAMEADHGLSAAFFALRCAKDVSSKKVFLSYLLREGGGRALGSCLAPESVRYVSLVKIGVDILDQLPGPLASKYEGLVEKPASILENLVISLEIPIAKRICGSYPELMASKRIAFYAYKACCSDETSGRQENEADPQAAAQMGAEAFPILDGTSADEGVRNAYQYKIAPSIPLCESILELSPSTEAAALNSILVAMRLCISFLNRDVAAAEETVLGILGDLERTETVLEIAEKAQWHFERTFADAGEEFEGWDSVWEAAVSDGTAHDFDLFEVYSDLLSAADGGGGGGGGGASPRQSPRARVAQIASFGVRLDLIHTLLSHEVPISFSSFSSRRAIEEAVEFIAGQEHYNIAIFVSKKFALDPSRIWESWGLGLLNLSEYAEARAKLERAVRSSGEGGCGVALRAVEVLEKGNMVSVSKIYDEAHKLTRERDSKAKGGWFGSSSTKQGARGAPKQAIFRNFSSSQIESEVYNECVYYIKRFAPAELLGFYFKHKQYQKACMLALESKSRDDVAALTKACVKYRMDDFLVNFFKTELARDSDDREVVLDLLSHAIEVVCGIRRFSLAYYLQMLISGGVLAAILALRTFKEAEAREESELWLQNTMEQILQVPGGEQNANFAALGVDCEGLGVSNLLEMRSIVGLQIDVMKHAEKQGSDFKSWDIVGGGSEDDMIAFHRRRAAELLLLKDGSLAFRVIQEFRLPAAEVYVDAIRQYCKAKRPHGQLIPLVKDLKGTLGDLEWDHVVGNAFFFLLNELSDRARAKQMMKLLVSDHSKVLALLALGKLDRAFEVAKSCADDVDVELILKHARSKGNKGLCKKCEEFLRR